MQQVITSLDNFLESQKGAAIYRNVDLNGWSIGVLITALVISLLICFFGLKLKRILCAIAGIVCGAAATAAIHYAFPDLDRLVMAVIAIGCITFFVVLFGTFMRLGMFFAAFFYTLLFAAVLLEPQNLTMLAVCAGAALIAAILAAIFMNPVIIIITALFGGLHAGQYASALLFSNHIFVLALVIGAVCAAIGMIIQFTMHSRKMAKQEVTRHRKVKAGSLEKQVEDARTVLDESEEEDDDDDGDDDAPFLDDDDDDSFLDDDD